MSMETASKSLRTHVEVDYERTALDEAAAPVVTEMARHDAEAGPEWKEQIDRYLASAAASFGAG